MRRGKIKANNSEMSSPASAASFAVLPRKSNNGGLKALIPIFLVISLAVFAVWYATERVPSVRSSASTPLHQFSEERAVDFLRYLLDNFGYRPTGTFNNEIKTVEYIVSVINEIKDSGSCKKTSSCPKLEIDIHNATGTASLKIGGLAIPTKFSGLTNILVKIHPTNSARDIASKSILINSHFDSGLGAIGATDAGALCAIMVEVIRNIFNSEQNQFSLDYPLIFMFNGAEETGLLGATGFADSHPWAKDIAFVLNMDSAGTGVCSLFQQNSDRVLKAYAKSAPHPHSSSFAVDLFKSGKFPGDTDFRVFRDSLNATGADFAYYKNGYMYHTLIDDMDHIQNGSIQHMGDNLLALLDELSKSRILDEPETSDIAAFFDIFGLYLVLISSTMARILSISFIILSLVVVTYNPFTERLDFNYIRFGPALFAAIFGVILGIAMSAGIGFLLFKVHPLSWFTHTSLIIPLFIFPNIFGQVAAQFLYHKLTPRIFALRKFTINSQPRPVMLDTLRHNSSCAVVLVYALMIYVTMNMGTSFYFLVGSPFLIATKLFEYRSGLSGKWNKFVYVFLALFPTILFLDYEFPFVALLTPVMGRVGLYAPVDTVIAVISSIPIVFVVLLYLPLLHKSPAFSSLLKLVAAVTIIGIVGSLFVFPYTKDTPKRLFLQHIADFDNNTHEFVAAGWDPIPLSPSFLPDLQASLNKKGLYLDKSSEEKPVFPYSVGHPGQPINADPNDWQGFFPFDRRLYGIKFPAISPEYRDGAVSKPAISVLSDTYDSTSNNRTLQVQISCNGSTWSNLRINGSLLAWDISEETPVPNPAGFYHAKHVVGYH